MDLIELDHITKTFALGGEEVHAIAGVSLTIEKGDYVAIMGASGSGKSTMMNILGCLDQPSSGDYFLEGVRVTSMNKKQLAGIRNTRIGFVFQGFNLLPRTPAIDNVMLPLVYRRNHPAADHRKLAEAALEQVGLSNRMDHHPNQLSGGQQQRVAIARALVNAPAILLADEPTGNLDSRTTRDILALFQDLNSRGITLVMVTHENDVAAFAKRVVTMKDGRVIGDLPVVPDMF